MPSTLKLKTQDVPEPLAGPSQDFLRTLPRRPQNALGVLWGRSPPKEYHFGVRVCGLLSFQCPVASGPLNLQGSDLPHRLGECCEAQTSIGTYKNTMGTYKNTIGKCTNINDRNILEENCDLRKVFGSCFWKLFGNLFGKLLGCFQEVVSGGMWEVFGEFVEGVWRNK